jgi:hypothetical protein
MNLIGGNQGWYMFHCHADGAQVYLDDDFKGIIVDDELSVPVYSTAAPYSRYTVTYEAYGFHQSVTRSVPAVPQKGETIDIYVDITPVPTPVPTIQPKPIGGDEGWFDVYCNVDGATVAFDNEIKGSISGNLLVVPIYTTGTPYTSVTVSAPDYETMTEPISYYPGKGETVDLYITLNRERDNPVIMTPEA